MPVYQYEGQHYDLPDGLTNEQAISKIKGHLGQDNGTSSMKSLGDVLGGATEAGMSMVAGMPSTIAGGLGGLGQLMMGNGLDKANETLQDAQKSNFGFGAYEPSSEKGKQYSENLGEALNKPVEWAGNAGEYLGGNVGRTAGEIAAGTLMNLAPIPGAKGAGAIIDRFKKVDRPGTGNRPPIKANAIDEMFSKEQPVQESIQPPPQSLPTIHVDPAGEATVGTMDPGTKLARERAEQTMLEQLDAQHAAQKNKEFLGATQEELFGNSDLFDLEHNGQVPEQTVRPVNGEQGNLFPPDYELQHSGAMADKTLEPVRGTQGDMFGQDFSLSHDGEMAPFDRRTPEVPTEQMDMFADKPNKEQAYSATPNDKQLSFADYKATVENLKKEPGTRYEAPTDLKKGYQSYLDMTREKQGGLFDTEPRQEAFKEALHQDTVPQQTADHPFVKAADSKVERASSLVEKLKKDVSEGKSVPTHLFRAEKDLENFKAKAEEVRSNVSQALSQRQEPVAPKGFNASRVANKQRGAVKFDWGTSKNEEFLKRVPGLKEGLKELLPDARTVEEFKVQEAATPDVQQNIVQKGFNYLVKGGVYQALKTHNPLIKKVVDRFLDADNKSKVDIQKYVHDTYAPAARALSKAERTEVWSAQMVAEAAGKDITPEMAAKAGFNAKQMKLIEAHQNMMNHIYNGPLKDAVLAAGDKMPDRRVAYAASRARGDFRRLIYGKDGEVVGIMGSNTRLGLDRDIKRLQEKLPDSKIGEERFYGGQAGRNGTEAGFNQMLEFLSKNDPRMKEFVEKVNELAREDAHSFMNAKNHTMAKKGIWGMEGKKLFDTAEQNAKAGMEAQVRYAETMIKWGELSKAVEETKPFMDKDNGINMPNAKAYLNDYIHNALGQNPSAIGRTLENFASELGKQSGVGTTIPNKVFSASKQLVNGLVLGMLKVPFLMANIVQPFKNMPEMKAWLESKGAKTTFDMGTGYRYMARALTDQIATKHSPVIEGALQYAKDNHVYSSDLFESGNHTSKGVGYRWQQATQFGASHVEHWTRKNMFLSMVHLMNDNGITPKEGLYQAARRATDMAMNNYSQLEAPQAYNAAGPVGKSMYNLVSFKHNELSRLSLMARALKDEKTAKPILVALAAQIAYSGVMGTAGYKEADYLVREISGWLGKPTSITKMLLDNKEIPDVFKKGMGTMMGADLSNTMGMTITPDSLSGLIAPGASKLGEMAGAAGTLATNPSEFNAKQAVRAFSPASVQGMEDRAWFSGKDSQGNELALNRNKGMEATASRNEADKFWKTLGGTGVNESNQKQLAYENSLIDKKYQDTRTSIVNTMANDFFVSGKFDQNQIKKYLNAQGDPQTLVSSLEQIATKQKVPGYLIERMKNAASSSITALHRAARSVGKE